MEGYVIGEEISRSRRYVASEARDTSREANVTAVQIDLSDIEDEAVRTSLKAEIVSVATTLTELEHENALRCLEIFDEDDSFCVVFERPEGASLAKILTDGTLPAEASIEVVSQALAGAQVMNESGVPFLVVNPASIILTPDGIAKLGGLFALPGLHEVAVVSPGDLLALVSYLAPEQLDGDVGDVRSIVFSSGLVLYRMLSGANPFDGGQIPATMYRVKCEPTPGLGDAVEGVPEFVAPLLVKAMAKDPELRYVDAEAMRADLVGGVAPDVSAVVAATAAPVTPAVVAPAAPKKALRLPFSAKIVAMGLIGVLLLGGVAFGGYSYMQTKQAEERARQAAIIAEGRVMAGYVSRLKSLRSELAGALTACSGKAKTNAAALRTWESEWSRRQSSYRSRHAAVESHNSAENDRYMASGVDYYYTWTGEFSHTEYTYTPQTWSYPSTPKKPAKVKANLSAEQARLMKLEADLNKLRSEIASSTPTSRFFGPVYQVMNQAATALSGTVGDSRTMMTVVVTQNAGKGAKVDAAKIKSINLGALDAPFQQLDSQVTASLAGLNVALQQILPETTGTVPASTSTTTPVKK